MTVLVAGAGGFIGGHLVRRLVEDGHDVHAVDRKPLHEWWQVFSGAKSYGEVDLRFADSCEWAVRGCSEVYDLSADMGGMGFIESHKLDCMRSVLIGAHLLEAACNEGVRRFFFSSSACVYPANRQDHAEVRGLRESDAYPADPEDGYGWEKLFTERLCRHYGEETGMSVRIARYHNVYGPHGSWKEGREKAPAAICRKVAEAVESGSDHIEIWGDGEQTRSFLYIDDCIDGTLRLMAGSCPEPVNLGSDRLVTINSLVSMIQEVAGTDFAVTHVRGPLGVRGRNSDNSLLEAVTRWLPAVSLEEGLAVTYRWIESQVRARLALTA